MPTYTAPTKNTLQVGLRQSNIQQYRDAIREMLLPYFTIGDLFVTLTFNDQYKYNELKHSEKLKKFYQKINRAVFGKDYDKGRKVLKTVSIAEYNNSQGVHVHMLLEQPEASDRFRGDFAALIKSTWVAMNWGTVKCAQDVRSIHETVGNVIDYMTKKIKTPDQLIRMDINNTKW